MPSVVAAIVLAVCLLCIVHLLDRRSSRQSAVGSRRSAVSWAPPLEWSWHDVGAEAAAERRVLPGCYTMRAVDQHRAGWCGACYLMAAVQMITDRWHVAIGERGSDLEAQMRPFVSLDAQRALDEYDAVRNAAQVQPGWNACRGGDPMRVLAAIQAGSVVLYHAPDDGAAWRGYPSVLGRTQGYGSAESLRAAIRIRDFGRLPRDRKAVMEAIYSGGPVAVTINAQCLLRCDADGVADTSTQYAPNHVATLIGWTRRAGELLWICRNSWGELVPDSLPEYTGCVQRGANACDLRWKPWKGVPSMPGHVLIPADYLDDGGASFVWCDVVIA